MMDSKEMNKAIHELEDDLDNSIYESCIGEKLIPYIGWFWRPVDFDSDNCWLGILPIYDEDGESNDTVKVGFMVKNKWFYDKFMVDGDEWQILKTIIGNALRKQTSENFKEVDEYMQKLLPKEYK